MKKFVVCMIICMFVIIFCGGCKSYQRVVHNNTFYSNYIPKIEMAVIPEIQYVGNRDKQIASAPLNDIHATITVKRSWWAFIQPQEYGNASQYVTRGVLIDVEELPHTSNGGFVADLLFQIDNKLGEGTDTIEGKDYNWAVFGSNWPFGNDQEAYLKSLGYNLPSPCLVKLSIRKVGRTALNSILYFESVEDNHVFFGETPPFIHSRQFNRKYIDEFLERSQQVLDIRKYTGEGLPVTSPEGEE